jgi:hypothetical protein
VNPSGFLHDIKQVGGERGLGPFHFPPAPDFAPSAMPITIRW